MCPPVVVLGASLAIAAASSALSYVSQSQAADAQEEHQDNVLKATTANANRAFIADVEAENARLLEQQAADTDELTKARIEGAKQRATARVAAGEAGVSGLSLDALLGDLTRSEGVLESNQNLNRQFALAQRQRNVEAAAARRQSRINSAIGGPIQQPSVLGAALQFGGDALSGVQAYNKTTRK